MLNILIEILLISITCNGLWETFQDGRIFAAWGRFIQHAGKFENPLGACPYCMPSIYGFLIHLGLVLLGYVQGWLQLPLVLAGAVFVSGLLHEIIERIRYEKMDRP